MYYLRDNIIMRIYVPRTYSAIWDDWGQHHNYCCCSWRLRYRTTTSITIAPLPPPLSRLVLKYFCSHDGHGELTKQNQTVCNWLRLDGVCSTHLSLSTKVSGISVLVFSPTSFYWSILYVGTYLQPIAFMCELRMGASWLWHVKYTISPFRPRGSSLQPIDISNTSRATKKNPCSFFFGLQIGHMKGRIIPSLLDFYSQNNYSRAQLCFMRRKRHRVCSQQELSGYQPYWTAWPSRR